MGFLPHNFFPAGFSWATPGDAARLLWHVHDQPHRPDRHSSLQEGPAGLVPAILPLVYPAILALPFLDLTMAFIRRTYAGRWWFLPTSNTCTIGCWSAVTASAGRCC